MNLFQSQEFPRYAFATDENFTYNGQNLKYPNIKLVYWAGGNPFHHQMNLKKLVKAFKGT